VKERGSECLQEQGDPVEDEVEDVVGVEPTKDEDCITCQGDPV